MLKDHRMHRLGIALVTALALALLCAVASAAGLSYPFDSTALENVNMRRRASSQAVILEHIPQGATVTVTGASGSYFKVTYNNREGYVLKKYISTDEDVMVTPTPEPVETVSAYPYDTTTRDKVNLRQRRSTSSQILTVIPKGATVTVQSVSGTFANVTYNGKEGYVKTTYLVLKQVVKPTATPSPTPTPVIETETGSYSTLTTGSTGREVTALQSALAELGFYTGNVDGQYGSGTSAAVTALQAANSYPQTGSADANLQAMIYSGKPLNAQGVATKVNTLSPIAGATIKLHNTGWQVETVQTRLKELGFYTGSVTGTYDSETASSVKKFQKKNGLTVDGVVGSKTWALINSSSALAANETPTPTPSPTPSPVPTFTIPSTTVRSGSTGTDAKLVQQRLKELGYYRGKADGKFGSASVTALKAFQANNGLTADGIAGETTYAILFSLNAVNASSTPTPVPTQSVSDYISGLTKTTCETVRLGSEGTPVLALQTRLTELGYYTSAKSGKCTSEDVAAITAFQKINGLTADGVAGYTTQARLFSTSALTATGALAGGVDETTTLRKGMTGDAVTQLQTRLCELGYLTAADVDGTYGDKTVTAVGKFQKANGLTRDGVAGAKTLTLLYSTDASAAATATPAPTATAAPSSLKQGDVSTAVKEMQQKLISLGYLSGKADGKFGPATYQALVNFQKANHLTADGIAGTKTLAKLNSSSATGATATATPAPSASTSTAPKASSVIYANWYTTVKAVCRSYPYATVYDYTTGLSWQVHIFSLGAHADCEPVTANDTAKMLKAFGGNTWNPKAVWVIFSNGQVYMASTHSYPHGVSHTSDNNFAGHLCIHFPRTEAQVKAIGSYATSHQKVIDAGWAVTQNMAK